MNKKTITAILFFLGISASAQKGIDNLIQVEKNFAAYSVGHSTKEAFQKFIDSSSLMFENGIPVKAVDFWAKREKKPGILNWRPQFAEIAASGDFGYTTGPWTFQNSLNDSVVARGQYSTIWYIDKKGEWKFVLDLGNEDTPVPSSDTSVIKKKTPFLTIKKVMKNHCWQPKESLLKYRKHLLNKRTGALAAQLSACSTETGQHPLRRMTFF